MSSSKLAIILAGAVAVGASATAFAGARNTYTLDVSVSGHYAVGSFGSTRNSANTGEYAQCIQVVSSSLNYGFCQFRDAQNEFGVCYTTDPARLEVLRGMPEDAQFYVTWNASSGQCDYVQITNSSLTEPKQ